ncbi:hypothetical protein ACJJTC_012777 [Scirpophaga incertulas]
MSRDDNPSCDSPAVATIHRRSTRPFTRAIVKQPKTFAFDHCFYSLDSSLPAFASQKTVFECLGRDILDNAFDGYNACIFAYGQTGELYMWLDVRRKWRPGFLRCDHRMHLKPDGHVCVDTHYSLPMILLHRDFCISNNEMSLTRYSYSLVVQMLYKSY